ncbi:C-terminal binding protein [Paenibacillus nasutitermitis]|uniref:C-terminal binding protein n=1 Tax=Paenibacillus nasutitermitis TaxID=1652958 RepID=UPI001E5106C2|nr:C-terminal binding protein [Paenibacillus nasutitermitis]
MYATPHHFPHLNQERAILSQLGVDLLELKTNDPEEIGALAKDAVALFVQYTWISEATIRQLEQCQVIVRYGIGYDNVDLKSAGEQGIYVCNVPHYCGEEVADHTMSLLLAAARKLVKQNDLVKNGEWSFVDRIAVPSLSSSVLGLVGLGYISRHVVRRAQAFGMKVVAYDPWFPKDQANALQVELVDFTELCGLADFVSLHVPLNDETKYLIRKETIASLKDGAVIINTARGGLIHEEDVAEAIHSGKLGMVCLDVLEQEPPSPSHPLIGLENVILTPHSAYYSDRSLPRLQKMAAEEVERVLRGEDPKNAVNRKWYTKK